MIFMIGFAGALLLATFIPKYIKYRKQKDKYQVLSFKAFKSLYDVNPSKWDIREEKYPEYHCHEPGVYYWKSIYMKSFIDQIRYSHFVRLHKKQMKREKYNRETEKLVKMWQDDIDTYRENAQKEIDDLVSRIEK